VNVAVADSELAVRVATKTEHMPLFRNEHTVTVAACDIRNSYFETQALWHIQISLHIGLLSSVAKLPLRVNTPRKKLCVATFFILVPAVAVYTAGFFDIVQVVIRVARCQLWSLLCGWFVIVISSSTATSQLGSTDVVICAASVLMILSLVLVVMRITPVVIKMVLLILEALWS